MCNSACTFWGHSVFYIYHSHIHLFIKIVFHCTGPAYFRLNNLITSLQLLQATQSMTFKKSNDRMIVMAAVLGDSTPLSAGLSSCFLGCTCVWLWVPTGCYFSEICGVFKYMKCLCIYIYCAETVIKNYLILCKDLNRMTEKWLQLSIHENVLAFDELYVHALVLALPGMKASGFMEQKHANKCHQCYMWPISCALLLLQKEMLPHWCMWNCKHVGAGLQLIQMSYLKR